MADDIDIEEHDVLDNPVIKSIFPDLSIFKKEVFDDSYEGYNTEENVTNVDEQQNSTSVEEKNNVVVSPTPVEDIELPLNHCNSLFDGGKTIVQSQCEESKKVLFKSNRIILGIKPNNSGSNEGKCERNIYAATVKLKNISPYLGCCKKYCLTCFILFPSKEALNTHIQDFHLVQTTDEVKLNKVSEPKHENNSEPLDVNKPKCNICHKYFASKNSLNKHRRNIHFILIRPSRKHQTITHKNVLKAKNTNCDDKRPNNVANSCFHCKTIFPNMQLLIEHLYDILQTKKETKDLENARENLNKLKLYKEDVIDNAMLPQKSERKVTVQRKRFSASLKKYFYRCPICFYCYNNEKCSLAHLLNKHKLMRKTPLKKVLFEPKCKFCLSEFKTVQRYNAHIYKVHRKMFIRKSGHPKKPLESVKNHKDKSIITPDTNKMNVNKNITPEIKQVIKEVHEKESSIVSTNIGILKSVLFRCVRCDIHFLNSHTATDHTNHMEILINWKCSICTRIFKNNDEHIHKQQHLLSNDFNVYGISESTIVLYKCLKCDIHFDENTYLQHYPACGKISTNHMKCKPCGILLDYNIYNEHNKYHKKKSNKLSDIVIIQTEVVLDKKVNGNVLNKDCKELRTRNVIANDTNDYNIQNFKNNHFFTVYYCHTCKCFVNDTKLIFHKKSLCTDFVPTTCKLCGLVMPRTNVSSHGRLHLKKKDLTLQDFQFCDLKSKKMISPPIPEFPRCGVCGIYFANIITKIRHECGVVDSVSCYDCTKDFSKLAYKLHMNYHDYRLGSRKIIYKKRSSPTVSKSNTADTLEMETDTLKSNFESTERFIIFTCKNCDISLDAYDLMIEHCQGHYNPVTNPLPSKICKTCNLKFSAECFESHKKLHAQKSDSASVIFVKFDLVHFTSDYKAWIKRVFIFLSEDLKQNILNKSIYKYENRIKMRIIQEGIAATTVYKCDKCRCFIDPSSLYKHLGNLCINLRKHPCKICQMPFISISSKLQHETVHLKPFKGLKSYRIVLFNREEDKALNEALQNSEIWFTLYKCRNCGGVISKGSETNHLCNRRYLKECSYCGLLFNNKELKLHLSKHEEIDSFKGENIKVILIGKRIENQDSKMKLDDNLASTFKGKVCDYLLYKCKSCQVCLCDAKSIQKHDCSNVIPMQKCSQCGFHFEAKDLDDHCLQHETDSDYVAENITIIEFENTPLINLTSCTESTSYTVCDNKEINVGNIKETSKKNNSKGEVLMKTAKLYKCPCGLHFMDNSVTMHLNICQAKNRISRQQCSKCGLAFSPNVLFKHLLSHHGNKNVSYTFDVIDVFKE